MIKFNVPKLEEILKSVYELTHMKVSIHNEKREEIINYLLENNIDYCLVYTDLDLREEYKKRMEERGNPPARRLYLHLLKLCLA